MAPEMQPVAHFSRDRRREDDFVSATLKSVGRCPARSDFIELCFITPQGRWKWCFPEPSEPMQASDGQLALTVGRYGVQAHLAVQDGLGPALPSALALPMIIAGAEVHIAGTLMARGR